MEDWDCKDVCDLEKQIDKAWINAMLNLITKEKDRKYLAGADQYA